MKKPDRRTQWRKANPEKHRLAVKRWMQKNPEKVKEIRRRADLKWRYGLAHEDFLALLARQKGRCAICKATLLRPQVDHDHQTGKIRALLCSGCNTGLGGFKDSVSTLEKAIKYLKIHAISN